MTDLQPLQLKETGEEVPLADNTEREYKRIPDGEEVIAEVVKIGTKTMPFNERDADGNELDYKAKRYEFEFKILEGEWKNYRVWGETFMEFERTARCKLYQWVQELYGQELPKDFTLDWSHLIGKRGRIRVGLRTWTRQDGGEGSTNYVKWLSRLTGDEESAQGTVSEFRAANSTPTAPAYDDEDEPF